MSIRAPSSGYRISSMPRRVLRRTLAKSKWAAHTIEDYELWIEDGRLHWENRAPRNRRLFLVVHTLTTVFVTAMGSLMGGLPSPSSSDASQSMTGRQLGCGSFCDAQGVVAGHDAFEDQPKRGVVGRSFEARVDRGRHARFAFVSGDRETAPIPGVFGTARSAVRGILELRTPFAPPNPVRVESGRRGRRRRWRRGDIDRRARRRGAREEDREREAPHSTNCARNERSAR